MSGLPIGAAAARLRTSARMLRYRERLGLLPAEHRRIYAPTRHRRYGPAELEAAATAIALEQRYDVSPATLAFGVRVLTEPRVSTDVAELARRCGRLDPSSLAALDFDQQKAERLLTAPAGDRPRGQPVLRARASRLSSSMAGIGLGSTPRSSAR